MTAQKLIWLLEGLPESCKGLEVVGFYPEHDYPYSVEKVELSLFRDPDNPDQECIRLHLGDE